MLTQARSSNSSKAASPRLSSSSHFDSAATSAHARSTGQPHFLHDLDHLSTLRLILSLLCSQPLSLSLISTVIQLTLARSLRRIMQVGFRYALVIGVGVGWIYPKSVLLSAFRLLLRLFSCFYYCLLHICWSVARKSTTKNTLHDLNVPSVVFP